MPDPTPPLNPVATTLSIFSKKTLVVLGLVSFGSAVLFLFVAALFPGWSGQPVSRGFIILICALLLSVFLWLIYPQQLQLTKIPVIDVGLQMAGTPVLFIILLLLLQKFLPTVEPPGNRYYEVRYEGLSAVPVEAIRFGGEPRHPKLIPVVEPNQFNHLIGLVAKFDDRKPFTVTLSALGGTAFKDVSVTFDPEKEAAPITLTK